MLKYLFLGTAAALVAAQVQAQTGELSCVMSQADQQRFITAGQKDVAGVIHLIIDKRARKVTLWETIPGDPNVMKAIYDVKFKGATAAWTIGGDDGTHDTLDTKTNMLTSADPWGPPTQWNCSAS